jgi:uncharacterized membrane protein YcaP (DUF421 family)
MEMFFSELFGLEATAKTMTPGQMCARTLVVFVLALVLLRLSGRRTFASNNSLDMIVKFMMGAILSRTITGDASFPGTLAAAVTLVAVHRALAYAVFMFPWLHRLVKGEASVLAEEGQINQKELRRANISEDDMRADVRSTANVDNLAETKTVRLEHDGSISVIKKE